MIPRIRAMVAHYLRSTNEEYIYYEREFDTCYLNKQLIWRMSDNDFSLFLEEIYEDKYQTVSLPLDF